MDANNCHDFQAGGHTYTVDKRYEYGRVVGTGAYGVVVSALDSKSQGQNKNVAIKLIPRAFQDQIDAKRILREIKLLKHFRSHTNIISILDMMPPPFIKYIDDYNDVYIVADLMETDLHRIIYSKQPLSIDHAQYFIYQVLRALKYIHSANVIHRDLKPSNLLVNSDCALKVCDFGLARGFRPVDTEIINSSSMSEEEEIAASKNGGSLMLTEYVVTRWYRAPEIMLGCNYDKAIDVWSVGCILAELIHRKPFFPGDDYIHQLTLMCQKLGKLPEDELYFIGSEKAKRFMKKVEVESFLPLEQHFPEVSPECIDLLRKMFQINPAKRITVEEALMHPFFESLHSPEDEPVAATDFDFSFENEDLTRNRLREIIWEEIRSFRSIASAPPRRSLSSSSGRWI